MQGSDKQQERPQNFELINLLFRNPTPIKTATRRAQQPGTTNIAKPEIFESF
ncbi:MAG: hypothetical protein AB2989_06310 [Candidatus Symbiodolus clandestinus]